ncbi:MAG: hypothetical protein ACXWI7_09115, partial [Croceibacterium sp.]
MSEDRNTRRAELIRHLKQQKQGPPPFDVAKAQQVIAQFEDRKRDIDEQLLRLEQPLPDDPYACWECSWRHGRDSKLEPAGQTDEGDDVLRCPFGHEE